jgi:N-ethylmaleimide reductase
MRDSDPHGTFTAAAAALDSMGLAWLHVVEPRRAPVAAREAPLRILPSIRNAFRGALIANGGYTADDAEAAIAGAEADMVSFGTLFLANPDLVKRVRAGAPLNEADVSTFYGGGARGYTDYSTWDRAEGPAAA